LGAGQNGGRIRRHDAGGRRGSHEWPRLDAAPSRASA
jgi:hypothetical protein